MDTTTMDTTATGLTRRWTVELRIAEDDERRVTHAEARLLIPGKPERRGIGYARRNPIDRDVPDIGDELATARALSDLAHGLLHAAVDDIEAVTREKVTLGS
jgi:hypothetical protein